MVVMVVVMVGWLQLRLLLGLGGTCQIMLTIGVMVHGLRHSSLVGP
jgi:hypothetical protein